MIITAISIQARNKDRVNVSVDGKYRFSLDVFQLSDLGIKKGKECSEEELVALEQESQFGKAYARALEYCLMRPHSIKEVRDYLYRKTRPTRTKTGETRQGISPEVATQVLDRLIAKNYTNDTSFATYWVENRSLKKGASKRKLTSELRAKGVDRAIIDNALSMADRSDADEIKKIIEKKRPKYPDERKLIEYLARQGFSYDDIKFALSSQD